MRSIRSCFLFFAFLYSLAVSAGDIGEKLGDIFTFQDSAAVDEILDPDLAFRVTAEAFSNHQLILYWEIEPKYYLYKNKKDKP